MCAGQIEVISDEPLVSFMTGLAAWPVLVPGWQPSGVGWRGPGTEWTVEAALAHLIGLPRDGVIMRVFVDADDRNSSNRIIQVLPFAD